MGADMQYITTIGSFKQILHSSLDWSNDGCIVGNVLVSVACRGFQFLLGAKIPKNADILHVSCLDQPLRKQEIYENPQFCSP
jgi:hypothetical protein